MLVKEKATGLAILVSSQVVGVAVKFLGCGLGDQLAVQAIPL